MSNETACHGGEAEAASRLTAARVWAPIHGPQMGQRTGAFEYGLGVWTWAVKPLALKHEQDQQIHLMYEDGTRYGKLCSGSFGRHMTWAGRWYLRKR